MRLFAAILATLSLLAGLIALAWRWAKAREDDACWSGWEDDWPEENDAWLAEQCRQAAAFNVDRLTTNEGEN
jgi:hypothetical protein